MPEGLITQLVEFRTTQHTFHRKFYGLCHMHCHASIVACDDLESHTKFLERFNCLRGIRLRWIEKQQETRKVHIALISTCVVGLLFYGLDRNPQHAKTLIAPSREPFLDLFRLSCIQRNRFLSLSNRVAY